MQSWSLPFTLSTSQTPTKLTKYYKFERAAEMGGFGTVADNGYGISYIVRDEDNGMIMFNNYRTRENFGIGKTWEIECHSPMFYLPITSNYNQL